MASIITSTGSIDDIATRMKDLKLTLKNDEALAYLDINIDDIVIDGEDIFKENKNRHLVIDAPPLVLPGRLSHYPKVVKDQSLFWRSIINNDYKYLWRSDNTEFLYKRDKFENIKNDLKKTKPDLTKQFHNKMFNYYKSLNINFKLDEYPINIGTTAAKFITSPRIIRELKKEGYL